MEHSVCQLIADEAVLAQAFSGFSTFALISIIVVCIVVLSKGADWMIEGAVHMAMRTGLPKIVIGATIISLGTTMPEAFVSVMAAFMGNSGLALGNGVGSIIADTGLIFGLTCILSSVPVNRYMLNRTGWIQVGAATLLVVIAVYKLYASGGATPVIGRNVGIAFLILLAAYMYVTYMWARLGRSKVLDSEESREEIMGIFKSLLLIVTGLFLVIISARALIPGASEVAVRFGVPDDVIAATMVAFGTSLPELITAVVAIRKGHPEITVGNIIGADVLNCLFVVGAAATAAPLEVPPNFYYFHFPAMLIILWSFRAFISLNGDGRFKKWQGIWLLGVYSVYVVLQYTLNV